MATDTTPTAVAAAPAAQRCGVCAKRLPLSAMPCRCAARFCALHRLPEQHACPYDYKAEGKKVLGEAWVPRTPRSV